MPTVSRWLDRFFEAYYERRPVNSTFVGVHRHDHRLPDLTPDAVAETLEEIEALIREGEGLTAQDPYEAVDLRVGLGYLRLQRWEYSGSHFHRGNPSFYTGEAIFGVMGLFLNHGGSVEDRLEAARSRLSAIPEFFRQAQKNLSSAPSEWTARAIRECEGGLEFLEKGIPQLPYDVSDASSAEAAFRRLHAPAIQAANALRMFRSFLEGLPADHQAAACGEEVLDLYLREGHFLAETADEIASYAESELEGAEAWLQENASAFDCRSPEEVLETVSAVGPDRAGYLDRYQEIWEAHRECVLVNDLVTWPEFPIRYTPRPRWARDAAPFLYFLFYRSPAAFCRPPVHDYLVTPLDTGTDEGEVASVLKSHNDAVIKLNHVVHHGGVGHHVQNWNAFRSPSRMGRVAAVDCASRIAMFQGGTMAEGWACYATDLMAEHGFLTPLERYVEKASRVRMCARSIVDVRFHQGRMSLDEAAAFYRDRARMPESAARAESVKNSMFPGAAVMYLMGTDAIHQLRREVSAAEGDHFSLRGFHDEFLSWGSVPVPLVAEEMRRTRGLRNSATGAPRE